MLDPNLRSTTFGNEIVRGACVPSAFQHVLRANCMLEFDLAPCVHAAAQVRSLASSVLYTDALEQIFKEGPAGAGFLRVSAGVDDESLDAVRACCFSSLAARFVTFWQRLSMYRVPPFSLAHAYDILHPCFCVARFASSQDEEDRDRLAALLRQTLVRWLQHLLALSVIFNEIRGVWVDGAVLMLSLFIQKPTKLLSAIRKVQSGMKSSRRRGRASVTSHGPPPPAPPPTMQAGATKMGLGLYCSVICVATGLADETENLFVIHGFNRMTVQEQRQAILLM